MTAHVKVSGTWKAVQSAHVKVSGTWKKIQGGWVNVSGTWKKFLSSDPVLIPQSEGTAFGSMTSGGGLAAAFDETTPQAFSACARTNFNETVAIVGKDFGAGNEKEVVKWKAWGNSSNNAFVYGFDTSAYGATLYLEYSSDNSTWNTADSVAVSSSESTVDRTFASVGAYRYWRLRFSSTPHAETCSELELYAV